MALVKKVKGLAGSRWPGIVFSSICLVLLILNIDLGSLKEAFVNVRWHAMIWGLLTVSVCYALFALRWKVLMSVRGNPGFGDAVRSYLIGHLLNNILMLRAGDVYRVNWLRQQPHWDGGSGLAALVTERLTDIISLAIFAVFVFALAELPKQVTVPVSILVVVGILLLVANAFVVRLQRVLRRLAWKAGALVHPGLAKGLWRFAHNLAQGIMPVGHSGYGKLYFKLLALSVIAWCFNLLAIGMVLDSVWGAELILIAATVMVVTNFGLVIPASPGGIGVYHSLVVIALLPFGYEYDQALVLSILLHFVNYAPILLSGLLAALFRNNMFQKEM